MKWEIPRLSGNALHTLLGLLDFGPLRRGFGHFLRKELGIEAARALPERLRGPLPLHVRPLQARRSHPRPSQDLPLPTSWNTLGAYAWIQAFRSKRTTPSLLVERVFDGIRILAHHQPSMDPMLFVNTEEARRDAEASTKRYAEGRPLGPLDGVPLPIKEELDIEGRGATLGLKRPPNPSARDATVVRWLREGGAVVLGHSLMTEYGMSPLGVSAQRVLPRNAINPRHAAGGSSTGAAVAVATRLVPVALGSDGGGSIRIPASYNGLFGIKPTFGRISQTGSGFGGTMAQVGPIGLTTYDLAVFLEATSGEDPEDERTYGNPGFDRGWLVGALRRGVRGLRIGVLEDEIDAAEAQVASACRDALRALESEGAKLIPVNLEFAPHATAIGYMTIGLEAFAALYELRQSAWEDLGPDLRLLCRVMESFEADDYLDAQRLRAGLRREVAALLREVDLLALPTTVRGAPPISDLEAKEGMADPKALADASRFVYIANLCGLPAGTAPVGTDSQGLPVGLQFIADAWDEATVLQVMAHLERIGTSQAPRPRVCFDTFEP